MAQPDGTYMWLQSYIQHYTLQKWMKEALRRGEQYLTYDQLMAKLDAYEELRSAAATGWTSSCARPSSCCSGRRRRAAP